MKVMFNCESQQFSHSAQKSVHYATAVREVPLGQRASITFCLTAACQLHVYFILQCQKGQILLIGFCFLTATNPRSDVESRAKNRTSEEDKLPKQN